MGDCGPNPPPPPVEVVAIDWAGPGSRPPPPLAHGELRLSGCTIERIQPGESDEVLSGQHRALGKARVIAGQALNLFQARWTNMRRFLEAVG